MKFEINKMVFVVIALMITIFLGGRLLQAQGGSDGGSGSETINNYPIIGYKDNNIVSLQYTTDAQDCYNSPDKSCIVSERSTKFKAFSNCDYMSAGGGFRVFMPAKTFQEYYHFREWARVQNPNVLTFHTCDHGAWSAWSACSTTCGNGFQSRTCDFPNGGLYAGDYCVGSSTQACIGTSTCTYTGTYPACPTACGLAASTVNLTSCRRDFDGAIVDNSFCPATKACAATAACTPPCSVLGTFDTGAYVGAHYKSAWYPQPVRFIADVCTDDFNYSYQLNGTGPYYGNCAGPYESCFNRDNNSTQECARVDATANQIDIYLWDGGGNQDDDTRIQGYILSTGDCSGKVTNGGWGPYGECISYAGMCLGYQVRSCNNPAPAYGGQNCPDHANAYISWGCTPPPSVPACFCVYYPQDPSCTSAGDVGAH